MFSALAKRIRKGLRKLFLEHARMTRPTIVPTMGWADPITFDVETADGRTIWVPLTNISHLSSDPTNEQGQGEDGKPPRARLHMANGDEHVLANDFPTVRSRIATTRASVFDRLLDSYRGSEPK